MCGIAGIASSRQAGAGAVNAMIDAIAHRGPDDRGSWHSDDGRIALGHARLAIIDLSPGGHQPMSDPGGNVIVFNGEIYNYREVRRELIDLGDRFRTSSDTEVILASYRRWGTRALLRFNGMFAFALYDREREQVVFARDRIGKKPLYYRHAAGSLAFASEATAILAAAPGASLDPSAIESYFAFGYIPGGQSIFKGIRRLLPGHCMIYDLRRDATAIEPYWSVEQFLSVQSSRDSEELLRELERLLEDSVRLRLVADVPVGVLLSGGLDSSLVTAIAARHQRRLQTFTVTFPGGGDYDERRWAALVAAAFGTEHHELPLPEAGFDTFAEIARHLDEPLGDPSIVPTYLISRLTRRHVTVALGGDGGDELFGGYGWYRAGLAARRRIARFPRVLRRCAAAAAAWAPSGVRGRNFIRSHAGDLCDFMITSSTFFDARLRTRLLAPTLAGTRSGSAGPEAMRRALWPSGADDLTSMSVLDLRSYLPDDILVKVDRASMAFALEMRAPFLDHRIIEFALHDVPSAMKASAIGSRFLERELARRLLPETLDLDRKQGFVMPIHHWFAGRWGDAFEELMRDPMLREWIDPSIALALLDGQRRGRTNGIRLFTISMFALWMRGLHERITVAKLDEPVGEKRQSGHAG